MWKDFPEVTYIFWSRKGSCGMSIILEVDDGRETFGTPRARKSLQNDLYMLVRGSLVTCSSRVFREVQTRDERHSCMDSDSVRSPLHVDDFLVSCCQSLDQIIATTPG